MVYQTRKTMYYSARGSSTLHGRGFFGFVKRAAKVVGKVAKKVAKNPIAKVVTAAYKKTVAPI